MIKYNTKTINKVATDSTINKMYYGGDLVYFSFKIDEEFKWSLVDYGGNTRSAACGSSSSISQNELWDGSTTSQRPVSIEIGDCVTTIGEYAFYNYSILTSCTIGSNVTSIDDYVFRGCVSLSSCTIGSGVTSIGIRAFQGCSGLTSINLPSGLTNIANRAFQECGLTSINIPSGIKSINFYVFYGCRNLRSITIPNSVTKIGHDAFYNCVSLTSIDIPSSVTSIGDNAFYGCSGLTSITVKAVKPPTLGSAVFNNTPIASGTGYIYVPQGSLNTYKTARGWSTYADQIRAIPT